VPGRHPLRRSRRRSVALAVVAVAVTLSAARAHVLGPDASVYARTCLAVGAAVTVPGERGGPTPSDFAPARELLGPLTVRRSFDSSLPQSFQTSAAADDARMGLRSFVSWKPPGGDYQAVTAGRYDRQITAWAQSVPRTGVFATSIHEPENDMGADDFVAYQRHVYGVVKAANPTIRWGPVYMAFWWDPAQPGHYVGDPDRWWPGAEYADFVGLDWYGAEPEPMTASPSFRHWYDVMSRTPLPLFIVEYGQYVLRSGEQPRPALERARAAVIRQDAAWIARHPRIAMWIYWQGVGPRGDWRMTDPPSQRAWREVAEFGCAP
jgi:hypothetical protein